MLLLPGSGISGDFRGDGVSGCRSVGAVVAAEPTGPTGGRVTSTQVRKDFQVPAMRGVGVSDRRQRRMIACYRGKNSRIVHSPQIYRCGVCQMQKILL